MSGPVSCSLSWNWLLNLKTTYNSPTYPCTTYGCTCPILFSLDSNVIQKCQGDEAREGRANASSLYDTLIAEEFLLNTTAQAEFPSFAFKQVQRLECHAGYLLCSRNSAPTSSASLVSQEARTTPLLPVLLCEAVIF